MLKNFQGHLYSLPLCNFYLKVTAKTRRTEYTACSPTLFEVIFNNGVLLFAWALG